MTDSFHGPLAESLRAASMTKIYERGEEDSRQGVFEHAKAIAPALDLAKARAKKQREIQV
jgi:hypothetical protein